MYSNCVGKIWNKQKNTFSLDFAKFMGNKNLKWVKSRKRDGDRKNKIK